MDIEKFAAAVAPAVRASVERATAPLLERIAALEARELPQPLKGDPGQDGRDGIDGKSVTLEDVAPMIAEAVAKAVATIPTPTNGTDGKDGVDGRDGRDGADGASVSVEDVESMVEGRVAGWALDFERRAQGVLERAIDRIPKPADGRDGRDGVDGLGFDDLSVKHDGERSLTLAFSRADVCKEFRVDLPVVIDRGVYKAESDYQRGDAVTWGGSLWIAQKDSPESKPGMGDGWRLAVKKGRDGKDGK